MMHCSLSQIAVNQTAKILVKAMPAYERETNIEFAEQSFAAAIKQLEGLLEVSPDNPELLLLASRSFATYAFGFIEGKIDIAKKKYDFEETDRLTSQAVDFYARAQKYGMRLIRGYLRNSSEILDLDLARLESELMRYDRDHVPGLFWTAFSWGNIVNLQQNDPGRLAELPRVDLLMQRVLELDERYFFGGPHMFYGVYYGGRPEMLGGDPEKAKIHFERAIEISGGRYLMTKFLLAKYFAVRIQDRGLFENTLNEIVSAPLDLLPEQGLANQLAKRNSARWLGYTDDVFFEISTLRWFPMMR
jgi:tetratricopeptide (TPR) repeat protein